MRAWHRKAIADGLKAVLPLQGTLRRIKRALVPYTTNRENDVMLLGDAVAQVRALGELGISVKGARVVEIGTGWSPVLPLIYRLFGAAHVITVDRERLLDEHTFRSAVAYVRRHGDKLRPLLSQQNTVPAPGLLDDADGQASRTDFSPAEFAIDYRAPYDFAGLPDGIADIIISRDVFEHVPEAALHRVMSKSRGVLSPGGTICHTIDMSDHWEHADKSISRVNFLQYEGPLWKLAGLNPQNFQNRLRRYEFVDMFKKFGFEILRVTGEPDHGSLGALKQLRLCARYAAVPHERLAVLNTMIVARLSPAAAG